MDLGERSVTIVPGTLKLDEFFTFTAECMLEHAMKTGLIEKVPNNVVPPTKEK